jgi:hypothetical protein
VRAELHALVRALAMRDWDEAAACVRRGEDDPWGPDDLHRALARFLDEHGDVGFDNRARMSEHTEITPVGPHQWTVRQRLLPKARIQTERYDVEGHEDDAFDEGTWAIEATIDLQADTNPEVRWSSSPASATEPVGPQARARKRAPHDPSGRGVQATGPPDQGCASSSTTRASIVNGSYSRATYWMTPYLSTMMFVGKGFDPS